MVINKQIVLSRSWGLSVKDAQKIANAMGIAGVRFAPAIVRGLGRMVSVKISDQRGARFMAREREVIA